MLKGMSNTAGFWFFFYSRRETENHQGLSPKIFFFKWWEVIKSSKHMSDFQILKGY